MVRSIRIELDDTALVRPSNAAEVRGAGSAGSTTMAETLLESSAEASASPTSPPPTMITSARSMCRSLVAAPDECERGGTTLLDRGVRVRDSRRQLSGEGHGDRRSTRSEA